MASRRVKQTIEFLKPLAAKLPRGARVLDIGCGERPLEFLFVNYEYIGIDVAESGREEKMPDKEFDGIHIPFEEKYFDAVLCTEVLEHAENPDGLVRDAYRVLKPGGWMVVTTPFLWGEHEIPYDFRRYSSFGLRRLLEESGFRIDRFAKMSRGVEAIYMLVQSERQHAEHLVSGSVRVILQAGERVLWRVLMAVWTRLYRFKRVYITNMVLVRRVD